MAIETDSRVDLHAVQAQKSGPIPIKEEDDVFTQSMKGSFPGNWLARLRDKREQPTKESAKPRTMQPITRPTHRQNLIAHIREAESLIAAEQRRIEEEDEDHEQLLCTLKETELEYRQARYLQRLEQKHERQTLIARVETKNRGLEEERVLFEKERSELRALLVRQEQKLLQLNKCNSASALLQEDAEEAGDARPRKKRYNDQW